MPTTLHLKKLIIILYHEIESSTDDIRNKKWIHIISKINA